MMLWNGGEADMTLFLGIRSKNYAFLFIVAFVLLQISLASINPHKLFSTGFESPSVKSYLVAMDINNDKTLVTAESNRLRFRASLGVMLDAIHRTATDRIDFSIFPGAINVALLEWQSAFGMESEARPQADMVALK